MLMFIFSSAHKSNAKATKPWGIQKKKKKGKQCSWLVVYFWVFKDMYIPYTIFDDVIMLMYKEINKRQPFFSYCITSKTVK